MGTTGPNPIDLTTVGAAKDWIPGFNNNPAPDDTIQKLVTGVSRDIVRKVGAQIDTNSQSSTYGASSLNAQIQFTWRLDGNGSNVLFLPARPVRSIVSLQVNGWAPPINVSYGQPGVYIENDGYSIAFGSAGFGNGAVTSVGWQTGTASGRFPMGRGNILISCVAGFGVEVAASDPVEYETPNDLEIAALQTIALNYTRRDRVGLESENIQGSASTTYAKFAYPPEALEVLNKYVRVPLGAQA